mgnify:CR=1 FL=1
MIILESNIILSNPEHYKWANALDLPFIEDLPFEPSEKCFRVKNDDKGIDIATLSIIFFTKGIWSSASIDLIKNFLKERIELYDLDLILKELIICFSSDKKTLSSDLLDLTKELEDVATIFLENGN